MSVYGTHIVVGKLKESIIEHLNIDLPCIDILLYSGAKKHMKKKHKNCLKYLDRLAEIIENPDYIGCHPNEVNSVELVKIFDDNVLVAVKLSDEGYLYISNMYDISSGKLNNRINSGRLKKFIDKKDV